MGNWIDSVIIILYLIGVFVFGLYMSRRAGTTTDFFLAGRRLPWYAIGLSLFASNISSGSMVGQAGQGYTVGMAVGSLEWHAVFALMLLAFVFLPYYHRQSITTIPEFLELRYNVSTRVFFAGGVLLYDMLVGMPFFLYSGGLVLEVMFGVPLIWSLVGIALFVGVYTTWGGLGAVVWTDVIQGCFMVVSGAIVTIFGLRAIGGIDVLMAEAGEKMHVALPMDHPQYPFPATFIGGYFLIGIYYWCQNQTIVQRTFGSTHRVGCPHGNHGCLLHQADHALHLVPSRCDRLHPVPQARCPRPSPSFAGKQSSANWPEWTGNCCHHGRSDVLR